MNYSKIPFALSLAVLPMLALAEADISKTEKAPQYLETDIGAIDTKGSEKPAEYVASDKAFTAEEALALAKKSQNPISNMRSFKFQNNTNLGMGPDDSTQNMFNVMPVLPFQLNDDILVISRTIIPVVSQPSLLTPADEGRVNGIGDTSAQFFFSPMDTSSTGGTVWGVGPAFVLPTATDDSLGHEKWAAGISGILLAQPGRWVYGGVVSNVWSFAGSGDKDTNLLTLQYFINYNFDDGWYALTSPIMTADWEADSDHRWTVPIGGGFGRLFKIGSQPVTAQVSAYKNVITPDDYGPDWQVRAMMMWMFPRK